jgi:hypothetical protein
MTNFDFRRTSRKCFVTGRTFERGEEFVSTLIEQDNELVRKDYSIDHWDQSADNCIGWWKTRLPILEKGRVYWAPRDVLLSYFHYLRSQNDQSDAVYVMSLLLIRKRIMRLLETVLDTAENRQTMILVNAGEPNRIEVPIVELSDQRLQEIQQDLADKLFTSVSFDEDE